MLALMILGAMVLGMSLLFLMPVLVVALIFGLAIFAFVFWIWMLVDAIQNRGIGDGEKVGWVLAIVFLHFIGALVYYFVAKPNRVGPVGV